jgi:hypothetical protein
MLLSAANILLKMKEIVPDEKFSSGLFWGTKKRENFFLCVFEIFMLLKIFETY